VYDAVVNAAVLSKDDYSLIKDELSAIKPWPRCYPPGKLT
jgi:hypothetical protein